MTPILRRINPDLKGQIRSLFVVLSDDLFSQILRQFEKKKSNTNPVQNPTPETSGSASDGSPPAAPNPTSKSSSKSRSQKRGASSDLSGQAKK